MVLAKGKLPDDARDPDAVVKFQRPHVPDNVSSLQKLAYDDIPPDLWSLGALLSSFVGMSFKWKGLTWVGLVFAVAALCNKRTHDADTKQIITGSVFAFSALLISAVNSWQGAKARALITGDEL